MNSIHPNISLEALKRRIQARDFIERKALLARFLPDEKMMLFNIYFVHGYTIQQIGALCGVAHNTVSRRLKRIAIELMGEYKNKSSWHRNGSSTKMSPARRGEIRGSYEYRR